jgi:predicted ABC-type ATPase
MPVNYLKQNKSKFVEITISGHEPTDTKMAVFMAGTPGSGKTEFAESLSELLVTRPVIIDADRYRVLFPGYNGTNSDEFQSAASLAVDKVFDHVVGHGYSFILDGTFSVGKAAMNIKRCTRREYAVQIYFVYQDPVVAWGFAKKRELQEGRRVPKASFIDSYFKCRENVAAVKQIHGDQVTVNVVIKDYENKVVQIIDNVADVDNIGRKLYNRDELNKALS